jgi:alkaline phosphatase D
MTTDNLKAKKRLTNRSFQNDTNRQVRIREDIMSVLVGIVVCFMASESDAAELIAGPMVGHTTTTTSRIWMETDESAKVRVEYWMNAGGNTVVSRSNVDGRTSKTWPHTGTLELSGLKAGALIHYQIRVSGRVVPARSAQVFWAMPSEFLGNDSTRVAEFSVGFGSCIHPGRLPVQPIFRTMLQFRPRAFLFIGDSNYMPGRAANYETDRETVRYAMAGYHREVRHVSDVQAVMASTPSYVIWDDHDFGPNNSDRTFKWRDDTLDMFTRFWANPSAGTKDTKGIFSTFRIADVAFFLLDDRYHRDPNDAPDRRTMFGDGQVTWLKAGLKASTATFKVIANGNSMVVNGKTGRELWDNFGTERDDFLKWTFEEGIEGVFFLVGDWHVGTLNRLHRPQDAYPLYELMSSNAAVRNQPVAPRSIETSGGHNQSAAEIYRGYNFGLLTFSGEKGSRRVALQIINEAGEVVIHRSLTEKNLSIE